ncbi:MAG TPA: hypothetical protein VIC84_23075 [Blastocatellia bacterium]|jgi:hypothetical protein
MPRKKSPKQQPPQLLPTETAPESVQTPRPAKTRPAPITVKKQEPLPPEAAKKRKDYLEDSFEIEGNIWRSIYD